MNIIKQRENGFVLIILEPALSRIKNNQCPSCGKPKNEWKRRTDWRCCSVKCTDKFEDFCIIRSWPQLRERAFRRDNYTCIKCGLNPRIIMNSSGATTSDASRLVADHIVPIALGGEQWDINNIQTLCKGCNKIKTKNDAQEIAKQRRIGKAMHDIEKGIKKPVKDRQVLLNESGLNSD